MFFFRSPRTHPYSSQRSTDLNFSFSRGARGRDRHCKYRFFPSFASPFLLLPDARSYGRSRAGGAGGESAREKNCGYNLLAARQDQKRNEGSGQKRNVVFHFALGFTTFRTLMSSITVHVFVRFYRVDSFTMRFGDEADRGLARGRIRREGGSRDADHENLSTWRGRTRNCRGTLYILRRRRSFNRNFLIPPPSGSCRGSGNRQFLRQIWGIKRKRDLTRRESIWYKPSPGISIANSHDRQDK